MLVLAIDTCLGACSAAVIDREDGQGGRVFAGQFERMSTGQAERLFPMIEAVMREAGIGFAQLAALAVTTGPGTFTGVRLGVAAVRGLVLASGLPVSTLSSLALIAAAARAEAGARAVLAVADARNGQVFAQRFSAIGTARDAPALLTFGEAAALLEPGMIVAGSGAPLVAGEAVRDGRAAADLVLPTIEPDARHFASAGAEPTTSPKPLYLRPPDAKPQEGKALPWA